MSGFESVIVAFKRNVKHLTFVLLLMLFWVGASDAASHAHPSLAQDDRQDVQDALPESKDSAEIVRQLASRDALVRQRAAEELARRASGEERKMVEGYRLQEKNSRVKVALDWALYRMGKTEALFSVVRDLNSSRSEQSMAYLAELEAPEPLYKFLARVNGNSQIKLLEVLARIGDAQTLEEIKPYIASLDSGIADAAKFAEREINIRLAEPASQKPTRQRQVGIQDESAP